MTKKILTFMVAAVGYLSAISGVYAFGPLPESEEDKVKQLRSVKQPWENCKDKFLEIKQQLQRGKILYDVPLQKYDPSITQPNNNKIVLVGLEDNSTVFKALFRQRSGANLKAELGAFEIAQYLGMENLVPPIADCELDGQQGVVSYYIDVEEGQNPWKTKCGIKEIKEQVSPESLNNFYAFIKIFGIWDLKWVNTLTVGSSPPYHILSLDNDSSITPVYEPKGDHFFVCWKTDPASESSPYADLTNFKATSLEEKEIPNYYDQLKRFFSQHDHIQRLGSEEEKKEEILKRVKSFLWGRPLVPHYIGEKGWWIQLYYGYTSIPPAHVESLSFFTQSRLKELNHEKLKEFFQDLDTDTQVFSNEHYEAILMRCAALLRDLSTAHE